MTKAIRRALSLIADHDDREAHDQGHDDDLQHVGVHEGLDEVGREDTDQRVHEVDARRGRFIFQVRGGEDREGSLEDIGEGQTDGDSEGGGAEVVDDGLSADGADLSDVPHGDDAGHDGEKDQRTDDPLDEVQENRTERLDVVGRKVRISRQCDSRTDGMQKSDEDLS